MAAMDEFREEREAIKNGTFKEKLEYFWDYYKIHTIVAFILIFFIGNTIYDAITATDPIIEGNFINVYNIDRETTIETLTDGFLKAQKIDTKEYHFSYRDSLVYMSEVEIAKNPTSSAASSAGTANYNTSQIIAAQAGADMLDFLVGPEDCMVEFAYSEYFVDLTEVLSEEQYAKYEPYFLYMDMAIIEKRHEAYDNGEAVTTIPIATSTAAEDLEKPIPVFIDMSHCQELVDAYGHDVGTLAFSVIKDAPHLDMTLKFIDYLMN